MLRIRLQLFPLKPRRVCVCFVGEGREGLGRLALRSFVKAQQREPSFFALLTWGPDKLNVPALYRLSRRQGGLFRPGPVFKDGLEADAVYFRRCQEINVAPRGLAVSFFEEPRVVPFGGKNVEFFGVYLCLKLFGQYDRSLPGFQFAGGFGIQVIVALPLAEVVFERCTQVQKIKDLKIAKLCI